MTVIYDWLAGHGLEQYADVFVDNHIDLDVLRQLNEDDMRDLGILSIGHRKKLQRAIATLRDDNGNSGWQKETERRHLTVMFCDMVESTQLAARLDPEDLADVISAYQANCAETIARFGGHVANFAGDGIVIYFGYPQAHEHDAERAVRAALGIVETLPEFNASLSIADFKVRVRIGIATGHVVVGDVVGEGTAEQAAIFGETPNLAARLQGVAEPNGVMISFATRKLLGELFEFADPRVYELKGIAQPVQAWAVIRDRVVASRFTAVHQNMIELVGRQAELTKLTQLWEHAKTGSGSTVKLVGEAGMGKSHLTQTLLERIAEEPHVSVQCQCSAYHITSALHPVVRHIERACKFERHDDNNEKLCKLEQWLSQNDSGSVALVAVFARLLNISIVGSELTVPTDAEVFKEQLLEALVGVFTRLANRQPLLFVFEDMHWVDVTTLDFVGQLIERAEDVPMLLLLTHRPDFVPPWDDLEQIDTVVVGRLNPANCETLIERASTGKRLPDVVVAEIIDRTDGIPLFVEELTRNAIESVEMDTTEPSLPRSISIPSTLQATLMARLDRLGAAKEIAQAASVLGRNFSRRLLADVLERSADELEIAVSQLADALLIFRSDFAVEESYEFKNALVRDIAYDSLLKRKRQALHQRTAEALERHFEDIVETEPEVLAYHFTEAGLHERAVEYWQSAGERALQRFGPKETANLFAKTLSLPEALVHDEQEMVLQADLGAVEMVRRGFDYASSAEAFLSAHRLARDDQAQLARSLKALCWFLFRQGRLDHATDVAGGLLQMAEKRLDLDLGQVANEMKGVAALLANDLSSAVDHFERSVNHYDGRLQKTEQQFDVNTGVVSMALVAIPLWLLGFPDRARTSLERSLAEIERLSHAWTISLTLSWAAKIYPLFGDNTGTIQLADRTVEYSLAHGIELLVADGNLMRGWAMVKQGDPDGLPILQLGLQQKVNSGSQILMPYQLYLEADARAQLDQRDHALELLANAIAKTNTTGERWWEAELHRRRGTLLVVAADTVAEGEGCLLHALEMARASGARSLELRAALSLHDFWSSGGRYEDANNILASVYEEFTEGFETPDLVDAGRRLGL